MKSFFDRYLSICLVVCALSACRGDEVADFSEQHSIGDTIKSELCGFYLLNEGNLGSNKATLDYYDFTTGIYTTDIYSLRNPSVVKELGDVGNDLQIYGNRMYAVINASNKIEVMTADSAIRIGQINVPNCRNLTFDGAYGYVTSFAGPISIDAEYKQIGYVMKFDTATLQPLDTCFVGFQPEGLAVANGKLYVANSGGYMPPTYDSTLSVIDLNSFTEIKRLNIDINLQHVVADKHDQIWVNSLGDYYDRPSKLHCIDAKTGTIISTFHFPVSNMCISGDSLYYYSTAWSYVDMKNVISYGVLDVSNHSVISDNIIADGSEQTIEVPYSIAVNPITKDIYLTDAKTYVIPGELCCYNKQGDMKWSVRTGDIPAHIAFLWKK